MFLAISLAACLWWIFFDGFESLQRQLIGFNEQVQGADSKVLWVLVYAIVCLISQLFIVPSGSLILMAAGFVFSPLLAAGIFSIAQILCSWPVYLFGRHISERYPDRFERLTQRFKLPAGWYEMVQKEGFFATVVLRLTPVIPSAAACLLAAGLGISLHRFIAATIAVCWIRPLFFASLGASLQSLSNLSEAVDSAAVLRPLLLVFFAAMVLFVVKLVINFKSRNP